MNFSWAATQGIIIECDTESRKLSGVASKIRGKTDQRDSRIFGSDIDALGSAVKDSVISLFRPPPSGGVDSYRIHYTEYRIHEGVFMYSTFGCRALNSGPQNGQGGIGGLDLK